MMFALVTSIGEGIMSTLFTPFVEHVLHGSSQDFGFVVASARMPSTLASGPASLAARRTATETWADGTRHQRRGEPGPPQGQGS
jgi:hypothetical protein